MMPLISGIRYKGAKGSRVYNRAYVTLDGMNLENIYSMKLTGYEVGAPEILTNYIDVPGRPGMLDATLALNGKVNYKTRRVSAKFHLSEMPHTEYLTLLTNLMTQFHGVENRLKFSFDPDWYYKGRFEISGSKNNDITADITISSDKVFPYKLEEATVTGNVSTSTDLACTGRTYNGALTIHSSSASVSVTYDKTTYQLRVGDNFIPEIHLREGNNTLTFKGSGDVSVMYERGIL